MRVLYSAPLSVRPACSSRSLRFVCCRPLLPRLSALPLRSSLRSPRFSLSLPSRAPRPLLLLPLLPPRPPLPSALAVRLRSRLLLVVYLTAVLVLGIRLIHGCCVCCFPRFYSLPRLPDACVVALMAFSWVCPLDSLSSGIRRFLRCLWLALVWFIQCVRSSFALAPSAVGKYRFLEWFQLSVGLCGCCRRLSPPERAVACHPCICLWLFLVLFVCFPLSCLFSLSYVSSTTL